MNVSCPECSQFFSVPDKAIGPSGRKLRCSKCGHQWHQMLVKEEPKAAQPEEAAGAEAEAAEDAENVVPFARFGSGEAEPGEEPSFADDEQEHEGVFGAPPLPRERFRASRGGPSGKRGKIIAAAAGGIVLLLLVSVFAARGTFVGVWTPIDRLYAAIGLGVPVIGEELVIQNVAAWRKAEGAIELLLIKGEIRNPTEQMQTVPTLAGKLTGAQGDVMQEWLFRSENQVILPGEKTVFQYELPQPGADAADVTVTFSEQSIGGGIGY